VEPFYKLLSNRPFSQLHLSACGWIVAKIEALLTHNRKMPADTDLTNTAAFPPCQGDQIGRILALWAIFSLGRFDSNLGYFYRRKGQVKIQTKDLIGYIYFGLFWEANGRFSPIVHLVTLLRVCTCPILLTYAFFYHSIFSLISELLPQKLTKFLTANELSKVLTEP
jgi:hypothetical protein